MADRFAAQQAVDALDNDAALDIVRHLADKFGWATCIFQVGDVWVDDGEDGYYTIADTEGITEEMRGAIANDRRWYRGMEEMMTESVSQHLPTLVVRDGDFHIKW